MSVTSVFDDFKSFLGHYSTEIDGVAGVLAELVNVIPLDPQTKTTATNAINTLNDATQNVNDYLKNAPASDVVVKESDLVTAVQNFFNSDAGKAALAAAVNPPAAEPANG